MVACGGQSGSGKTTLLERLISSLVKDDLKIGCVKHTHHNFEIDQAGKDSHKLRKAGASQMLLGAPNRFAFIAENDSPSGYSLRDFCRCFDKTRLDLILVEGFGEEDIPKIEVRKAENSISNKTRTYTQVIAVVGESAMEKSDGIEYFEPDNTDALKTFLLNYIGWRRQP